MFSLNMKILNMSLDLSVFRHFFEIQSVNHSFMCLFGTLEYNEICPSGKDLKAYMLN
jgi:hypothetical protein